MKNKKLMNRLLCLAVILAIFGTISLMASEPDSNRSDSYVDDMANALQSAQSRIANKKYAFSFDPGNLRVVPAPYGPKDLSRAFEYHVQGEESFHHLHFYVYDPEKASFSEQQRDRFELSTAEIAQQLASDLGATLRTEHRFGTLVYTVRARGNVYHFVSHQGYTIRIRFTVEAPEFVPVIESLVLLPEGE